MSRINTNVQSLIAQRILGQNNQSVGRSLERLSTGLRINRGADDPAGLIASENLRSDKAGLSSAIGNAERANQVVSIAEGGLQEVSGLLTQLNGLVTTTANTAGLSTEEKNANQLQIDSILQTINRLSDSTSFQGKKLLNGNLGFSTSGVATGVSDFNINGAKLGFGATTDVNILVTQSAQQGALFLSTGGALDLGSPGEQFVLEIGGKKGSRQLSFSSGTTVADVITAINSFTDVTGVSALTSGTGIRLDSTELGKKNFVSVKVIDNGNIAAGDGILTRNATNVNSNTGGATTAFTAAAASNGIKDTGQDIAATINGVAATTDGATASINTDFLAVDITLTTATAQAHASTQAFTITGGGADFQLGSNVDIAGKVSLGVDSVAARNVGNVKDGSGTKFNLADLASGKGLNVVDGDLTTAQDAIAAAIKDVSGLRGRLGAFSKNTVGATIRSLGVSLENTTAAESTIRDANFAKETAGLTRAQILTQSATNILGIANSQPQSVLSLLG